MTINYEKRYKDARQAGDTAATRLAGRSLAPELETLAVRYDGAEPLRSKDDDAFRLDPGLAAWRKERGVE